MVTPALKSCLPYFASGIVVKGFGRGSKQLGCPTANFAEHIVDALPISFDCGVYYGWASVDNGPVYGMVMSVGYNPQFDNTKKTMETHLLHDFVEDFYGCLLKIAVLGHIREMEKFSSLDALMDAINMDKELGRKNLESLENQALKNHPYFLPLGEVNFKNSGKFSQPLKDNNSNNDNRSAM